MDRTAPITVQGEKLVCAKLLCCESDVSIARARYGRCHWPPSWKPFCLIETEWELRVKASWFRTSGRYAVYRWLHALNNIASRRSTARGMGAVRWDGVCKLTLSCRLRSWSERRIETKFSLQLETLDVCITIFLIGFILPASGKQDASFDAGDTLWRPSSSWVDFETRSLLLFVANPRGLKLNYTHWHWASKSTWGWLHLFSQTARLVSHASQQTARGRRPRIKLRSRSTTWQLVVLVPRSTDTHVAKHMAISRNATLMWRRLTWSF